MRPTPTGHLTREDYEYRYAEALAIIRTKITREIVGEPTMSSNVVRLVQVGTVFYSDEMVFTLAWSPETARDIIGQYRGVRQPRR
jgi:hypothetical protein